MAPSDSVLRVLLAAAPDALLVVDATGTIVFANDQVQRLFGWTRAELVGQPIETLIPQRFHDAHPALRAAFTDDPTTRPMAAGLQLWARRRDGTEFAAEISLSGFQMPDGVLIAAAIRDVTLTRSEMAAAVQSEHRFRAVLASSPDAIVGVDAAGHIEIFSDQAERLFGWTAEEVIGKQIEMLVPASAVDSHVGLRAGYVSDPSPRGMGVGVQLSGLRKDGSTFPAEISLNPVGGTGDMLILAAVRDVSGRLALQAEVQRQAIDAGREQSQRLESMGRLAGGVAHDFNNLLGVIITFNTLLAKGVTDPVAIADHEEILAAAERGATLTRQLLTFARRDVLNRRPLDLNDVVRSMASMLDRTLGEDIEVRLDLAADVPMVFADQHQLEQVILNLAINARDAMPAGGVLMIETAPHVAGRSVLRTAGSLREPAAAAAHAMLRVSDTGEGMPPEVAAQAFEPFFTTKPHGQGTGLGLATVHGIVTQNAGQISIESSLGVGTTVTVTLARAEQAAGPDVSRPLPAKTGHERILLVEDEAALRVATARLLADAGYAVITATDGVDALKVLERTSAEVDLLISDVGMPQMRGDELVQHMVERGMTVPVIFVTGYDSTGTIARGVASSRTRVLTKPVARDDLLRSIRESLDNPTTT